MLLKQVVLFCFNAALINSSFNANNTSPGAKRNLCFVSHNCGRILISKFLHHILTRHFPIILSFVWPVSHSNNTQSLCFPKEILTSTVIYHYAVPYHFLSTNHIGSSTLSWTEYSRSPLRYFEDK